MVGMGRGNGRGRRQEGNEIRRLREKMERRKGFN